MDELVKNGCVFDLLPGTLIDTAGNNTVTNNGATPCPDHNGRANRGWTSSSVSNYISFPLDWSFAKGASGKFSVVIPVYIGSAAGNFLSISIGTNTFYGMRLYYDANLRLRSQLWTAGQTSNANYLFGIAGTDNAITLNNWYLAGYTYDNSLSLTSKQQFYLNGVKSSANGEGQLGTFVSFTTSNAATQVLNNNNTLISTDRPMIFNRVLTDSEFKKLYNEWSSH